jgi:hypothetical protein
MIVRPGVLCSLLLCFMPLTAGAAGAKSKQPLEPPSDRELGFFTGTREETLGRMKRVGLLPARPLPPFNTREDLKASLQDMIAAQLKAAGMEVVAPDAFLKSFDRLNHEIGGIYDLRTGATRQKEEEAVYANARREFIENEHLDGYVIIRVVDAKASFSGSYATWDGVRERSTGRLASGLSGFLKTYDNFAGSLPALSLTVQISNPQHQIVYGRAAGIQLVSYFDIEKSKGVTGFRRVPYADLLRDSSRLERAAGYATLPLRVKPEQISAGSADPKINPAVIDPKDLPPEPAAVDPQPEAPAFGMPRDQILASVHRVALAPMSTDGFAVDADAQARYIELIRAELKKLGWEIVDAPNARAVFAQQLAAFEKLYDPYTGVRDEGHFVATRKAVFTNLGVAPPDAILWPSLQRTIAQHNRGDAKWDGVSQSATTLGPATNSIWLSPAAQQAGAGNIPAVSLRVQLADAQDRELYTARGGIQLLAQMKGNKPQTLTPEELFQDQGREGPAVHAALRSLVMSEVEIQRELNQKSGKKK